MEKMIALARLSALGQDHRLDIVRLLVKAGGDGLHAGDIAATLRLRPNTLSGQLAVLKAAGLVVQVREGRHVRCRIAQAALDELIDFLLEDCCGGRPEACHPAARTKPTLTAQ